MGSKLDEVVVECAMDPYEQAQIADLPTGTLAELKTNVDAEVARRLADYRALLPARQTRARKKTPSND